MPSNTIQALAGLLPTSGATVRAARLLQDAGTPRTLLESALAGRLGTTLTPVEARRIRAAWRFVRACIRPGRGSALKTPEDAVRLIPSLGPATHEAFWILGVDARLRPLTARRVTTGEPSGLTITLAAALRFPVAAGATGVFLLHNHPSGTPWPSAEDTALTAAFDRACAFLGLQLHDHLIVAGERWHSCRTGTTGRSWLPTVGPASKRAARRPSSQPSRSELTSPLCG